jgi:quinoprotein glucose dehydrogenase
MVPSLVFPSSEGGGSWGGVSYDPTLGYIFVNTRSLGTMAVLQPIKSSNILESYAKRKIPFNDPQGYPCSGTPWGELMAIDANTGETVWREPLGEYEELTARGVPKTGTPNAGGTIVTAGGVVFVGATADAKFRAFDAKTGRELWSTELPANAINTPMTYRGKNGKQYVAIVTSNGLGEFNHPRLPEKATNKVHVFALP